jgi:hypothetical protein
MSRFDQDGATFDAEWFVHAHVWAAQPKPLRVASMFVLKNAINHKYFFTTEMPVWVEVGAWRPANQGCVGRPSA